ncbi:MAG: zf-HC2 domain-containing protein [Gemmatimonadetes bacterium]|nr:zf-HC2 domain-containing protein [Gemmatimonadota bacterium]
MIDCIKVIDRLWDYLDGELPAEQMEEIAAHLAECGRCNPQYRYQFTFLERLARHRDEIPPPPRESVERLKRLITA